MCAGASRACLRSYLALTLQLMPWLLQERLLVGFQLRAARAATMIDQLDQPVHHDAYPEVDDQPEIKRVRMMPPAQRQVRHQNKKVEKIANNNCDGLFEEPSIHGLIGCRAPLSTFRRQESLLFRPRRPIRACDDLARNEAWTAVLYLLAVTVDRECDSASAYRASISFL